jgi:hypothetical protein
MTTLPTLAEPLGWVQSSIISMRVLRLSKGSVGPAV